MTTHKESIVNQFTRQAITYAQVPDHTNEESLQFLLTMAGISNQDTVLDVACGPGIVACAFAPLSSHVTGIDITPAMLEQAQSLAQRRGLTNLSWQQGEGEALPFADHSFSIVLSRYAFHHCLKPDIVLSEMIRVCRPGGKVLVADVSLPSSKVEAYDHLEKLRDPSHSHALSLEEFQSLATASNLRNGRLAFYEVKSELERQMAASFPNAGDEDEIRQIFIEDIGINKLGINTHLRGDKICYTVPITVMVAHKAA